MLDIKLIRENPQEVESRLRTKDRTVTLDPVLKLDARRREILQEVEELKHSRNVASKEIGENVKAGKDVSESKEKVRQISERIKDLDDELRHVDENLRHELLCLPNLPHSSVPVSDDENDKITVHEWGTRPEFDFEFKNHLEISDGLGLFDFERAAKISQSQFSLYKGDGAMLEWALIRYMIDTLTGKKGFTLVIPPYLVNEETMYTSGNLPKFGDQIYKCANDALYLIPTSEVPLTSMHRDEILPESMLPLNYCSYTACFRREAGAHGKGERGLIRVHQFNKVEMFKFVHPDTSYDEHEALVQNAQELVQGLGLHYRTTLLVTTDIAQQSAKTYDIEVWLPGQDRYYEVSSCSNCEDFQARRGNIRFRPENDKKPRFLHTLNGSGLATSRLMVCLLETYQQPDGSVIIPEVLRAYMGGKEVLIPKK
jgi:seryl-tRNA synthetase